ncbi:Crp/Fnr family transcriptional regulator [Leeia aquatica]|uniref:Crp/Fnr family transcriptional regulator n=1 Tax=Leeia aquatica TaxID=2725557 RepID=A0A847S9D5_9NEIS|nr:Crp/Fnr family transcriptional regulator [Leeia aquatica]NLR73658.1 Crp/Fnr family transcriptional regulator [Leeia aquatica]
MVPKLDVPSLLGHLNLFAQLDEKSLARLAERSQQVRVPRHAFVFHRGDPASGLYVVAVGRVKLSIPAANGQEKVIEFFGSGQAFGEAMMFIEQPYMVQAQALEDCLLLWVSKQDVLAVIDRQPAFARSLLTGMAARLHTLMQDIEMVSLHSASQRLIHYLLNLPCESGLLTLPVNKNVVASKLGLTPETLSRLLHQFSDAGIITVRGRKVTLHSRDALQAREASPMTH